MLILFNIGLVYGFTALGDQVCIRLNADVCFTEQPPPAYVYVSI
jgi:hypothetical protein